MKIERMISALARRKMDVLRHQNNEEMHIKGVFVTPKEHEAKLKIAQKEVAILEAKLEKHGVR